MKRICVGIPVSKYENKKFLIPTLLRYCEIFGEENVAVIAEMGAEWVYSLVEKIEVDANVISSRHPGSGNVRDTLLDYRKFLSEYDVILFSDAHVLFKKKMISELLMLTELISPETPIISLSIGIWRSNGDLSDSPYRGGIKLKGYPEKIEPTDITFTGMSYIEAPNGALFLADVDFMLELKRIRKKAFLPYYGIEDLELGIAAWRLGYSVLGYDKVFGYHYFRDKHPEGRIKDISLYSKEKWFSEAIDSGLNPFWLGYWINKALFMMMHYPEDKLTENIENIPYFYMFKKHLNSLLRIQQFREVASLELEHILSMFK